jgi:hypothetical protein
MGMTVGLCLLAIAVGAILKFAVTATVGGSTSEPSASS